MGISDQERTLLRDSLRNLLADHWPVELATQLQQQPEANVAIWRQLAEQGLSALGIDVEEGGLREILLVQEELGRAACPAPMLGASIVNLLLGTRREAVAGLSSLLDALHGGEAIVALGMSSGDADAGAVAMADGRLKGKLAFVEHAAEATHLLVEVPGGMALAPRDASVQTVATPGYSVPALSEVAFAQTPAVFIGLDAAPLADALRLARLQLAARALGAARRGFELVVEHVKNRRQFGVAIGSFQAIQHKLANCLMSLDGVSLTLDNSASQHDLGLPGWRAFGDAATVFAGSALRQVVLEVHHAFGAIGFSEEHELPRHFRRIHGDLARLGGVQSGREAVAAHLLDGEANALPAFDLGEAANRFRAEVRDWLAQNWNGEHRARERELPLHERAWNPAFSRKLADKGWLSLSWPRAYGGQERTPLEQSVYVEEMALADAPMTAHTCAAELIAPAIIAFGTDEQKAQWLPAMARNEISCCLGYSEPEAGSDLASLRSRAERDGDHWIINGQKLWTTTGDKASHVWLAVRTDPEARPKHAGISIFLVPLDTPGITIRPSMAMYGHTFCTVFYDDVRVPDSAMVGGVNNGWQVITHALASERIVMGGRVAVLRGLFEELVAYLKSTSRAGRPLREDVLIRDRVGQIAAEIEVARQFALRSVMMVEQGKVPVYEAAVSKVYYGELLERALETAIDILGTVATLSDDSAAAPLHGRIEQQLRTSIMMVVGGGAAEIQRTIIAQRGLGLPRG
jgi:alkylation response protein AidB-like acyl-CoA dehydrogenase